MSARFSCFSGLNRVNGLFLFFCRLKASLRLSSRESVFCASRFRLSRLRAETLIHRFQIHDIRILPSLCYGVCVGFFCLLLTRRKVCFIVKISRFSSPACHATRRNKPKVSISLVQRIRLCGCFCHNAHHHTIFRFPREAKQAVSACFGYFFYFCVTVRRLPCRLRRSVFGERAARSFSARSVSTWVWRKRRTARAPAEGSYDSLAINWATSFSM